MAFHHACVEFMLWWPYVCVVLLVSSQLPVSYDRVNMSTPLSVCSKEEQRAVIRFLWSDYYFKRNLVKALFVNPEVQKWLDMWTKEGAGLFGTSFLQPKSHPLRPIWTARVNFERSLINLKYSRSGYGAKVTSRPTEHLLPGRNTKACWSLDKEHC